MRLQRSIGLLRAAYGVSAIVLAPPGRPLRAALLARAAFDAGDAVAFGTLCPTRRARITIAAVAAGWGAPAALAAARSHSAPA